MQIIHSKAKPHFASQIGKLRMVHTVIHKPEELIRHYVLDEIPIINKGRK
jgi:hypothetical protein